MSGNRKKRSFSAAGHTLQNILIFVIIIVAFLGSALLFWNFNTGTLRSSIEAEVTLSSSMLAEDISRNIAKEAVISGEADYRLSHELAMIEEKTENENDVWLADPAGKVYYHYPDSSVESVKEFLDEPTLKEARKKGTVIRWIGKKGLFLLGEQCLVVRPLYDDESIFLVIIDHANAARALQRRQFALFMSIDILLMLVMLVLLGNSFSKFRRQLIRFATMDELTQLANRKNFNDTFAEFVKEGRVKDFSLFLLDIDYFKQINDNYSHAAGDHALKALAAQIREMTKKHGGFAGRWGGDEFIGVLPVRGEEACEILKDLCRKIEAAKMEEGFSMTISAGTVFADQERDLVKLAEKADLALYASKENGRNQATLYSADMDALEVQSEKAESLDRPAGEKERERTEEKPEKALKEGLTGEVSMADGARQSLSEVRNTFSKRMAAYIREKLIDSTNLGVRWMAPFVAGGGILIALAFLFDAASVNLSALPVSERANFGSITAQAAVLKSIGGITFNFMLPVFAGFMAYGIAGEEAFMTGFVGGYMSIDSNSGFIGAMIAGFAAGVITNEARQFTGRLPGFVQKAAPIIVFPVFNLLLMQVISLFIITPISSAFGKVFTALLEFFVRTNSEVTGMFVAMMMAVDMGGIVNKVAYNYGVACIAGGRTDIMASVMIGGMVPPVGIALSILLFRDKFTLPERERGIGALFMGLSFITEGALPFVFTDIFRVIPSCMLGSAVAGLLSQLFGCRLPAPHGGIFVFPVIEHPVLYAAALAAGSLITAVVLGLWKTKKTGSGGQNVEKDK